MKTNLRVKALFIIGILVSLLMFSCNKDTVAPKIYLNGESKVSVIIGDDYNDLGVFAEDNKDGELTDKVVAMVDGSTPLSDFNWKNRTGEYIIGYEVFDEAGWVGNAERKVKVYNQVEEFARKYKMYRDNYADGQVQDPIGLEYGDVQGMASPKTLSLYANTKTNGILEFRNLANLGIKILANVTITEVTDSTDENGLPIYSFGKIKIEQQEYILDTVKYRVTGINTDPVIGVSGCCIVNSTPSQRKIQLDYIIERFLRATAADPWPLVNAGIGYDKHNAHETFTQVGGEYIQE